MSTTNPADRLTRRPWFLPAVRAVLWTSAGLVAFLIAFVLFARLHRDAPWVLWLLGWPIIASVMVGWTDANTDDRGRTTRYPWPYLLWMLGLWAASAALGGFAAATWQVVDVDPDPGRRPFILLFSSVLLLVGVSLLVLSRVVRARRAQLSERVRMVRLTGAQAKATVTEVRRSRIDNVQDFYRVTLRFTDDNDVTRWHTVLHHRHPPTVGSTHWLRYDPKRPGRKATIFVEWTRR